ncbi:MAG: hypothetical protein ABI867_03335 [Kofleriaceae bacterium]
MKWLVLAIAACASHPVNPLIGTLRSDTIQLVTYRPPGSTFAVLDRRVMITGPADAKRLTELGEVAILDQLVPLLDDPERAYAASAVLAQLTQHDEKTVEVYATDRAGWWTTFGPSARRTWQAFLDEHRGELAWDPETHAFLAR